MKAIDQRRREVTDVLGPRHLVCAECGAPFEQPRKGRPRKTCYEGCAVTRARRVGRGEA